MGPGRAHPRPPQAAVAGVQRRLPPALAQRLAQPLRVRRGFHQLERLPSGRLRETRLSCPICEAPLARWGADPDQPISHRRVPGTETVIQEVPHGVIRTADYATVLLEMQEPDGGRTAHSLVLCRSCQAELTETLAAEAYLAVLEQLALDAEVAGEPVEATRRLLDWMARRTVVRVVRDEA